jgi:hypothetical protein
VPGEPQIKAKDGSDWKPQQYIRTRAVDQGSNEVEAGCELVPVLPLGH